MASTQAMCTSFKQELLTGIHVIGTDTLKVALYLDAATLGAGTTEYSTTSEVGNSGSYVAGGSTVTFQAPAATGTTVYTGPASASTVSWTTFSATGFSAALIYNSSKVNGTTRGRSISVHTFASQTITAGTFTITFPTNDATTGLLRFV